MKNLMKKQIVIFVIIMLIVPCIFNVVYATDTDLEDFWNNQGGFEDTQQPEEPLPEEPTPDKPIENDKTEETIPDAPMENDSTKDDTTTSTPSIPSTDTNIGGPVTGIEIKEETATLKVGETLNLSVRVLPSEATNLNRTWESDNATVAIVVSGVVVALSEGTATITVTTEDGGFTDTCSITVVKNENQPELSPEPESVEVTGIALNKETVTIKTGEISNLKASVAPENATNKNVIWTSDNESSVLVVSGVIIGIAEGQALITATTEDGNFMAQCVVNVEAPEKEPETQPEPEIIEVTGITLDKEDMTMKVGEISTLKAKVLPENATNNDVIWESDNESVVIVVSGLIICKSEGTATVKAITEDGAFMDTCVVTVEKEEIQLEPEIIAVTGISLDKKTVTMKVGEISILKAKVLPENATNGEVIWTSDNESVVIVVEGVIICNAEGTAKITAKTKDGEFISTCVVTVEEIEFESKLESEPEIDQQQKPTTEPEVLGENKVDEKVENKKEEEDTTIVKGTIPKAGRKTIFSVIFEVAIIAIVIYKKYKRFGDI